MAVVGGGMAGLTAALSAAERGADVILIEAGSAPGGSACLSSGRIWTLPDYETFRRTVPLGDARLQCMLTSSLESAFEWLASSVGHLGPQATDKPGIGRQMLLGRTGDRGAYFRRFAERCAAAGVRLEFDAELVGLVRADAACELDVRRNGLGLRVMARSVVLATGGMQGDREGLSKHLGPEAALLMLRSNPHSRGAGVRAGLAVGGVPSRGCSGFYGKSMPRHADLVQPGEFKRFTLDIARHTLAVNVDGLRFVDEAAGSSGEAIPNAGLYQPDGGRYFLLINGSQSLSLQVDDLADLAARAGVALDSILLEADTADDLADRMAAAWGVDRHGLALTLAEATDASRLGHGQSMLPPRRRAPVPLRVPPIRAVACRPAITIPFGGLSVDPDMTLTDANGTPIAGVYAAGADAGGVYAGTYAGGLAWALASGRVAGLRAAARRGDQVEEEQSCPGPSLGSGSGP
ncbi:FAD-dependent oxidoreductase [Prosthecomicrobium sp. N25]|uniref:FAD-dependent oxidoreductase n=1 Tax=Prosthecomicrobium sp. N25 TaxID=3129254 RepID=UPI003076C1A3